MTTQLTTKQQLWTNHIQAWSKSGLTQQAYCNKHSLPPKLFSLWKSRFSKAKKASPPKLPLKESSFVPVSISSAPTPPEGLALTLPSGISLTGITKNNAQLVMQLAEVLK